ncbi:uncharacterized protein LOC135701239 [Ochlerotatus camptorhynchus]|uniref:uncharacterized protein LOC135701239 n=1 Tax=Ochlerotatus camptorhynchus TaxID=644619 RepID=UPI0031D19BC0
MCLNWKDHIARAISGREEYDSDRSNVTMNGSVFSVDLQKAINTENCGKIMAPPPPTSPSLPGYVHFADSETLARQIFTPARYNVPLFVYKKLSNPRVLGRDELREVVDSSGRRRRQLLKRMTNYGELPNWKDHINVNLERDTNRSRPAEAEKKKPLPNPFKLLCRKSLRNGHKEWTLAPNRYRLTNNISDMASNSTGSKGPYQCFTGERFTSIPRPTVVCGCWQTADSKVELRKLLTKMDRLAHNPKRHLVGTKVRRGDKTNDRACFRLAISQPTLCWRNPLEPGPNRYFKGIFDIPDPTCVPMTGRQQRHAKQLIYPPPVAPSIRHSYCAEPFPRPPPGRYQLPTSIPTTTTPGPIARHPSVVTRPVARFDFTFNPAWNPYRQPATLRMHTIDIPIRRRKRGRNIKVAFGSATARFKDQEFFPIGAHKSVLPRGELAGVNKMKKEQESANHKIVSSTANAVVRKASKAGSVVVVAATTDPLANLKRTRAKLFVIPRQHQTKRIPSIPDVALLPYETDQRPASCVAEPAS